jgi:hypothetical protein
VWSHASFVHHVSAADNAKFYAENGVSFVMGTTGGDPAVVAAAAEAAGVYAVVSPQMGKQVSGSNCLIIDVHDTAYRHILCCCRTTPVMHANIHSAVLTRIADYQGPLHCCLCSFASL